MARPIVIVGGGQGAAQLVSSLRSIGVSSPLCLIAEEATLPYQRPPLSKSYLKGETDRDRLQFKSAAFYERAGVDVRLGVRALTIDAAVRRVVTSDGGELNYDKLVLATGLRHRDFPVAGTGLPGVHRLRTVDDADTLRSALSGVSRVAIVGGGYIGLEFASVARSLGKVVTILEAAPRILSRVAYATTADLVAGLHAGHGVEIRCGAVVRALVGDKRIEGVELAGGAHVAAELVLIGIGGVPRIDLAHAGGLAVDDGVLTEACGETSDPHVWAVGDCANSFSLLYERRVRLESVQNAVDGAKAVASSIAGQPSPYRGAPWFWSDQYDAKLQTAGLHAGADAVYLRAENSASASVYYFRKGRLIACDALNAPRAYVTARRAIESRLPVDPTTFDDTDARLHQVA